MTPDRFQKAKRIYNSALKCEPAQRDEYLSEACAGDEALRKEVESLLGCRTEAQQFFKAPAVQAGAKALARESQIDLTGRTVSHYAVIEKIGEGGMGVVYKARDTHLDRFVAIKVLPADMVADENRRRRFAQEAKAASALNHPNIVTVHDISQADGVTFIAMECVEGKTLDQFIPRKGMPLNEALKVAVQVADALVRAHAAGIVHRDLKPANVMVNEHGLVKVLDFGLAKLTEVEPPTKDDATRTLTAAHTEEGTIVGTVAYMSPEQAEGKNVDARSDIFSFGALLYEMITGHRAFQGDSKLSTLSAVLHREPKPLEDVPRDLEKTLTRCLRKDPDWRFQHMDDVKIALAELRGEQVSPKLPAANTEGMRLRPWLWGAPVLAVLVVALAWWGLSAWRQRVSARATAGRIESLAVLPLANLSGDPAQEYFADGMTEALISNLAQIGALRVISRTSVMQFKGTRKALPEIARELKVDAVLEGSVLRAGNRVRITAQLIEGATDRHLWAQNYEGDLTDVLALQGEVARAAASQIQVRLTPQEQTRLAKARPVKPEAYEYYLRGIHLMKPPSRSNAQAAIGMLERAVEIDPGFAVAYADLAQLCAWMVFFYAPEEQAQWEPRAYAAVDKALALDPDLAEAHVARGQLLWTPSNRFPHETAIREFRQALASKPNSSAAHMWLAVVYNHVGLLEEALGHARRALAIDPTNQPARTQEIWALVVLGRYEDALSLWQGLPQSEPAELIVYVLALAQQLSEARAKIPDLLKEHPEDPGGFLNLLQALLFAADGKQQEAEEQIQKVVAQKKAFGHFHHAAFMIVCVYARMHKPKKALDWLEQAADGYPCYRAFQRDPNLDSLHKEPRFIAFLERVKRESNFYKTLVASTE